MAIRALPLLAVVALLLLQATASLDGCSLYSGGDLLYSTGNGALTSGLLRYDITSQQFSAAGNVYKDAHLTSLFTHDDTLYFSGDLVRVGKADSMAVGRFQTKGEDLLGLSGGLWTNGGSLPTDPTGEYSPAVLFADWSSQILLAGQFQYQTTRPNQPLVNLALFDPTMASYSALPQQGLCPSSGSPCSVISLATSKPVNQTSRIFAATMQLDSPCATQVVYLESSVWGTLPLPSAVTGRHCTTVLFDSLTLAGDQSTLFAVVYSSDAGSLTSNDLTFSLVAWDLADLTAPAKSVTLWTRSCRGVAELIPRAFPAAAALGSSRLLVAVPEEGACLAGGAVEFRTYSTALELVPDVTVPAIAGFTSVASLQVANSDEIYVTNGTDALGYSGGSWRVLMNNGVVSSFYYSVGHSKLYAAFHTGYETRVVSFATPQQRAYTVFTGGVFSPGTVLAVSEMNEGQFMIGGDFKYVGPDLIGAKFAARWDGAAWQSTLTSNSNTYLEGWRMLAMASVGDIVFGIVDQGRDATYLPVVRWKAEDGWLFLYQRPVMVVEQADRWDNTVGTVHVDHSRNFVYFGGQFDIQLTSGVVCSGAVRYSYSDQSWAALPANLTKVNAFGSLNNQALLQIGGRFNYKEPGMFSSSHDNYLVLDVEANTVVSDVPSVSGAEIFSFSQFPNQAQYSFLGGDFARYGVEQLHYVSGTWSISVAGNSPLQPPVYAMSSRNEGEMLFVGGAFPGSLAMLDIGRQEWVGLIPSGAAFRGTVRGMMMSCPFDENYDYYDPAWERSSGMEFYTAEPTCTIPVDAGPGFRCPEVYSGWQIFGLCFTVFVTLLIVGGIGFVSYRTYKQNNAQTSVEYI